MYGTLCSYLAFHFSAFTQTQSYLSDSFPELDRPTHRFSPNTADMAEAAAIYPPLEDRPVKNTICLFDVDGTLTPARRVCPLSSPPLYPTAPPSTSSPH